VRESFWLQSMLGGIKGQYDCIKQFSEVDYTEDLKQRRQTHEPIIF
jgi:non-heme chloroperoxidase